VNNDARLGTNGENRAHRGQAEAGRRKEGAPSVTTVLEDTPRRCAVPTKVLGSCASFCLIESIALLNNAGSLLTARVTINDGAWDCTKASAARVSPRQTSLHNLAHSSNPSTFIAMLFTRTCDFKSSAIFFIAGNDSPLLTT